MFDHTFAVMAHRDSPYLRSCLDSILRQTVPSEICLCTSTPSPFIEETAKMYGIPLFVSQMGTGMANDWTFSLQQSKTPYVTLAHQDDVFEPDYTAMCLQSVSNWEDVLICFTDYIEFMEKKERKHNMLLWMKRFIFSVFMPAHHLRSRFWKITLLRFGNPIAAPSVMFSRVRLEGFAFSPGFTLNVDWDAWERMARMDGRFIYVDRPLVRHRIHGASATSQAIQNTKRREEDLILFRRFWPAWLAHILLKLYSISYSSNQTH